MKKTRSLEVTSPYNCEVLANIDIQSHQDAEQMISLAQQRLRDRAFWLTHEQRLKVLHRLAELMRLEEDELAMTIAKEGGKPLTDAKIEVIRAIAGVELAAHELMSVLQGQEIPMELTEATQQRVAFTQKEPIGIVVAISAFNHPLNLIVHQVVPSIATGCPIIIKPSELTPLSCLKFCQLIQKAGLPDGWVQPIVCDVNVAEWLVTHREINFFSFIGSAKVGWMLRSKLAAGVRCALEHGGVAPVIIDENADISRAIPSLIKGGFYHAGQVCVSVQRIFVPDAKLQELSQVLTEKTLELTIGDPSVATTNVGPLILPREVDRIHQWVTEAIDGGANCLAGGYKNEHNIYQPTILTQPATNAKVSTHEIFGPVICVYGYNDVQQAIQQANSLPFAFQAAIFTQNIDHAIKWSKQLDASAVMINDHTAFRSDWMPFAGRRQSGYGVGGIGHTMQDLLMHKMTVIHWK